MNTILNIGSSGQFTDSNSASSGINLDYQYQISLVFEEQDNLGYSLDVTGFSVMINGNPLDQVGSIFVSDSSSFIPYDQMLDDGFELLIMGAQFDWDDPEGGRQEIGLDLYTASDSQIFDPGTTPQEIVQSGLLGDFTMGRIVSPGESRSHYLGLSVLTPIPEASTLVLVAIGSFLSIFSRRRKPH